MDITKENFNQYVEIATNLACEGLYNEATAIALNAFEAWASWDEDETENQEEILDDHAVRILTTSQRLSVNNTNDCALLAEILKTNVYWSDNFISENLNFTGAWILKEKALSYHMLAQRWADGQLYDIYMDYAQSYIKDAIKTFGDVAEAENDVEAAEMCNDCKIDLAMIQRNVSNKLARMTAISLFGENLTEEQKERLMEIYQASTDVLFNDYFNKAALAIVQHSEVENDNVKNDVIDFLLDEYAEPGNDDLYWWAFTRKNTPEERKRIRFVERIEDAADNDFEEIPWVFTLDRYPFDIEFDEGEEPVDNSVYEIDPENTDKYHRIR